MGPYQTYKFLYSKWKCQLLSRSWFFVTPWTVACQACLSTEFSRQEYWSGLPCPSPGDLSKPGIEPQVSCIADWFFTVWATREFYISLNLRFIVKLRLPRWLSGKESACQCRRYKRCGFDLWVRKIPWRRKWQSSILAWKIPWTEEPGRLQSTGSQRVGHNWARTHIVKLMYNYRLEK